MCRTFNNIKDKGDSGKLRNLLDHDFAAKVSNIIPRLSTVSGRTTAELISDVIESLRGSLSSSAFYVQRR